jgi:hypothetical protein
MIAALRKGSRIGHMLYRSIRPVDEEKNEVKRESVVCQRYDGLRVATARTFVLPVEGPVSTTPTKRMGFRVSFSVREDQLTAVPTQRMERRTRRTKYLSD